MPSSPASSTMSQQGGRRRARIRPRPSMPCVLAAAAILAWQAAAAVPAAADGVGGPPFFFSRSSSSHRSRRPFVCCFGPPPSSSSSSSATGTGASLPSPHAPAAMAPAAASASKENGIRRRYVPSVPLFASSSSSSSSSSTAPSAASASPTGADEPKPSQPPQQQPQQRERVHVTRFDGQEAGTGEEAISGPKPVTCLWYDTEGDGAASTAAAAAPVAATGGSGGGGDLAFLDTPGAFFFLGGGTEGFLRYVQQELGCPKATAADVAEARVADLGAEKDRFAALWRSGKLLVEDPNALDVINNKTSFGELLMTYTHRMRKTDEDPLTSAELVAFLQREYGPQATAAAVFDPQRPPVEAMAALKDLLQWFKDGFPYYKSTCLHCGHKDQPANRMLGVVAPSGNERAFNATLTEVYCCGKCGNVFRFPRAVALSRVIETRRGRCGEYSRLFFKAAEALRYKARWVVDWEDHVWVEVELPGKGWVHCDPCEAVVDEPLLYQGWGKNQTYILAFTREGVEDVTHTYTSDAGAARARRTVAPGEFDALLREATGVLRGSGGAGVGAVVAKRGRPPRTTAAGGGGGGGGKSGGGSSGAGGGEAAAAKEANGARPIVWGRRREETRRG